MPPLSVPDNPALGSAHGEVRRVCLALVAHVVEGENADVEAQGSVEIAREDLAPELGTRPALLETNLHGVYLGNHALEPVFAELARRHATVLLHPTSPPCWQQTALGRPRPMIEFIFDTARAVTDLVHGFALAAPGPHCWTQTI